MGITHSRPSHHASGLVYRRYKYGKERVFLPVGGEVCVFGSLGFQLLCQNIFFRIVRRGLCLRFFYGIFSLQLGCQTVGFRHVLENFGSLVGRPEFERCRSLKEFPHTFRLLDSWQLHEDTAGIAHFLDIWLRNAETVHPVPEHLERIRDGAFRLSADKADDFSIGGFEFLVLGLVLPVQTYEYVGQPLAVRAFAPGFFEQRDEIRSGSLAAFQGSGESLLVFGRHAVFGESLHDILQLHLKHHVHTALEVESEVYLLFPDIIESVTEVYLLG